METLITLLTDFGNIDSYVAEVKGVLLSPQPRPTLVDISHEVPAHDIYYGAFQLLRSYRFFSPATYHLAVVDPGVGSSRNCLYVRTGGYYFVGPDNGLSHHHRCEKWIGTFFSIGVKSG